MRWMVVALGLATATMMATAAEPLALLSVQRSEGMLQATDTRDTTLPLSERSGIPAQTRLRSQFDGRLALVIQGGGHLVLGGDSDLLTQSVEPGDATASSAVLRLQLKSGVLVVDARKLDQVSPADVRIALPYLNLRIYGSNAWVQSGPDGDEVCALAGAVEVDTPTGHDRLDRANECLRWYEGGGEHLAPGRRKGLATDFLRVSFGDDQEAQYAAQQELQRLSSPLPATPPPAPAAAAGAAIAPTPSLPATEITPPPVVSLTVTPPVAEVSTAAATVSPPLVIPAPAASAPAPALEAAAAVPATAPTAVATAPAAASKPSAAASGSWRLVLASFTDRTTAQAAVKRWQAQGLKVELVDTPGADRVYLRALSGRYASKAEAEAALKKLRLQRKSEFKSAWILAP